MTRRSACIGLAGALCLALGGSDVARRALYGHGRWHELARTLHHRLVDFRTSRPAALPTGPITIPVTVDTTIDRHSISPYIYGMAFAPPDEMADLRLGVNRWGGNDKSRYNWVLGNACNAARDWRWANRAASDGDIPPGPSSAANRFVQENRRAGAASLLTIPTIGWVARDSNNQNTSLNVPAHGGAPLTTADGAIAGYDPTSNRQRTSVRSLPRKGAPFSEHPTMAGGVVYQDEWAHHLVRTFGNAAHGGVRFYAMDNEPDLWDSTHTDIHPARMGYDDVLSNFLDYATAIKGVDPTAEITGPVSWGWLGYEYSALDRGDDNFRTHADRARHGDEPFLSWFLKGVRAHDLASGRRSLDVLDVHYYPQGQGLFSGSLDGDAPARRLRSTRSLWDPTYTDESWIGQPVQLIPRLKQWIAEGYPGTKIGITEWNFGADKDINGALSIADALGIFGRENIYLANYWAYPPKGSPGYLAFKLYRNVDGRGFGDSSCQA
ncbi:MAG TPA: glycoside hydrolase family 44 protein, partial [Chloroflexota bacterium]|nr:glycoside hydrolase family 44 protein [Chloroflexota bacterium]